MGIGTEALQSLVYMSASLLPSPAANSVHVTKMSAAFAALGIDTTLIGLGNGAATSEAVRRAYGVPDSFAIRLVRQGGLLDYRVRYALGILLGGWVPREATIYTRVPKIAALAALLHRPCVLELHHPPTRGNDDALRRHLCAATGGRRVVITQTLKDWAVQTLGIAPSQPSSWSRPRRRNLRPSCGNRPQRREPSSGWDSGHSACGAVRPACSVRCA